MGIRKKTGIRLKQEENGGWVKIRRKCRLGKYSKKTEIGLKYEDIGWVKKKEENGDRVESSGEKRNRFQSARGEETETRDQTHKLNQERTQTGIITRINWNLGQFTDKAETGLTQTETREQNNSESEPGNGLNQKKKVNSLSQEKGRGNALSSGRRKIKLG